MIFPTYFQSNRLLWFFYHFPGLLNCLIGTFFEVENIILFYGFTFLGGWHAVSMVILECGFPPVRSVWTNFSCLEGPSTWDAESTISFLKGLICQVYGLAFVGRWLYKCFQGFLLVRYEVLLPKLVRKCYESLYLTKLKSIYSSR